MSFRREKFIPEGGPDGGNGGRGGDVVFRCVDALNTLIDFRYQQHFRAQHGEHGKGRNRSGSHGQPVIVNVPVGTEIMDEERDIVLFDMMEVGQEITVLKGGDGGFGNTHYKSATNQAPRKALAGWPGTEMAVWLRLKLIADVGLVGLPNAGKSTFLAACSEAKPKIADYPFTTLHPNLGIVKIGGTDFVMADIPGLIEGASEGYGLGDRFLGHVERTATLLHLIDITQDDIVGAYKIIRKELEAYDEHYGSELSTKDEIIVLTKADALGEELSAHQAKLFKKATKKDVFVVSAAAQMNVEPILYACMQKVQQRVKDEKADRPEKAWSPL